MVSIAVVVILLALALPSLRLAREGGVSTKALILLRQAQAATDLYANDNRERFMFFATPGDPAGSIELFGVKPLGYPKFFLIQSGWSLAALRDYLAPIEAFRIERPSEGEQATPVFVGRAFFTCTAFAAPEFWVPPTGASDLTMLRHTSRDQVAFPHAKGSWLDETVGPFSHSRNQAQRNNFHMACFDGSARIMNETDYQKAESVTPLFGEAPTMPPMTSAQGLRGRDFH